VSKETDDIERFINYIKGLPGRSLSDILLPDADYYERLANNATDDSPEPPDEESESPS
jgi:hypothetical protein